MPCRCGDFLRRVCLGHDKETMLLDVCGERAMKKGARIGLDPILEWALIVISIARDRGGGDQDGASVRSGSVLKA